MTANNKFNEYVENYIMHTNPHFVRFLTEVRKQFVELWPQARDGMIRRGMPESEVPELLDPSDYTGIVGLMDSIKERLDELMPFDEFGGEGEPSNWLSYNFTLVWWEILIMLRFLAQRRQSWTGDGNVGSYIAAAWEGEIPAGGEVNVEWNIKDDGALRHMQRKLDAL